MDKQMHYSRKYNEPSEINKPNEKNKLELYKKAITDFFNKNRSLVVLLPLLVVMIIAVIILYSTGDKPPKNTENYTVSSSKNQNGNLSASTGNSDDIPSGTKVEVLPQTERTIDQESKNVENQNEKDKNGSNSLNPFDTPMKLAGIILGNNCSSVAIIETNNNSFVVKEGEFVNKVWKVLRIEEKGVLLINGDKESYVTFPN